MKAFISLLITLALLYVLNQSWIIGKPIPPLGKFLDPFHGFWQNAESGTRPPAELNLAGLRDEVTVLYDSAGIPHIFAKNDDDLYFAQGYVTAMDRLWQMEFQTHAAAGRISEIVGKGALDFDRSQRRIGMLYAAERSLKAMENNAVCRATITQYTAGVNAYIHTLKPNDLPFEYKLLGYGPEPWTNLKAALLLMNMAKTLNNGEKDLEMTNALKLFGKETLDLLYPDDENVGDPIVDNPGGWKFKPIQPDTTSTPLTPQTVMLRQVVEKPDADVGSNNWAVSGSKTATGSPMLCNDPHLNLSLPSIWYIIHLNAPGVNVMGASLPGAPTVISGFNDSIAWGVTNAQRDLVDWYKVQFHDKNKDEYLSDGQWKKARKVIEHFKVKGSDPFDDTVIYTHHGPVPYDESFHGNNEKNHFAYRWIAHEPSTELLTFHYLNRSKNFHDYMEALNYFHSPAQNFAFASVQGDIAMRVQGLFPVRRKEEGRFILDGTKTSTEWKAFIPNEQNIMIRNPSRGFVSSANQYPADNSYPYYIHGSSFEAYRNRRINQVLSDLKGITTQDLMKLQFDVFNLKASESLPDWLSLLDTTNFNEAESSALRMLREWDYQNTVDAEGATYYEAWWDALFPMIWDEIDSAKVKLAYPTTFNTIRLIRVNPELSFFDVISTTEKETARDVLQKSFSEGVRQVENWKENKGLTVARWADYKDTFIGHLLRMEGLSYHVEHGGNHDIVNASSHTAGPSWRMVVSLEKNGVKAWGVYPGGQSGNPGSPYYSNLLDRWSSGQYFKLNFSSSRDGLKNATLATTTLNPVKP